MKIGQVAAEDGSDLLWAVEERMENFNSGGVIRWRFASSAKKANTSSRGSGSSSE
ncbi:MAG TPA: hypothetical protein VFF53_13665 [Geobacteraceae bacterium]|nr:hypothetical protein [Geobacteraceae bacterium]